MRLLWRGTIHCAFALISGEASRLSLHLAVLCAAFSVLSSSTVAQSSSTSHDAFLEMAEAGKLFDLDRNATCCAAKTIESSGAPQQTAGPLDLKGTESIEKGPLEKRSTRFVKPDFNRSIYFRNKIEFSLDVGWLPINVPFPFDVLEGDPYDLYPLRYTLMPVMASVRWHLGDPWGPPVLRGNWDLTFSLSATAIPRGAETHYFSYNMGIRRNFIPRNWRLTPYWDVRAGVGFIDAKGPLGVYYAQGQNFTFNINMGAGARYNFNPRYAFTAGLNWMHISNGNMSSPQYSNYGINVYGPMFGLEVQLRKHRPHSE